MIVCSSSLAWGGEALPRQEQCLKVNEISKTFPEARITVYWKNSDYYTSKLKSSSGVRLRESHVAADPRIIPYGSKIRIEGWGQFTVVDTGGAVKRRTAAKKMGKNCPVIDVFFMKREDALRAAKLKPSFAKVEVYNFGQG